jgi:hypothetical protein
LIAGEDAVFVGLAAGAVASVEVFGDGLDCEDADAGGEGTVEGAVKVCCGDRDGEGEGGDLTEGMDAGVGAARALGKDGLAGDTMDCLRECTLDGWQVGLNLPAVVGSSVVGEDGLPVRHGLLWTVSRLVGWRVDC